LLGGHSATWATPLALSLWWIFSRWGLRTGIKPRSSWFLPPDQLRLYLWATSAWPL
jgi:hypothetical protein